MSTKTITLLIAASGTGGHLFPALALAEQLPNYQIEWLGVPNRLEQNLVPSHYPLNTIAVEGFQTRLGLKTFKILLALISSVFQVKKLLKERKIELVFTTGGYIAAPAIIAARLQGIPVILHESNFLPGKVTRFFSRWCKVVALGFPGSSSYLPQAKTVWVGNPVRSQFRQPQTLDLPIPSDVPLIVIFGGSQGAIGINQLVRECAPQWLEMGAYIVHLTGDKDPEANSFQHPHYLSMAFYENMAGLLQRANLAISRAGSGSLTELAVTSTPAILIPYPYAAEDHQTYNARVFADAGAAYLYNQAELNADKLNSLVLDLLQSPNKLEKMKNKITDLAVGESAEKLATLLQEIVDDQ